MAAHPKKKPSEHTYHVDHNAALDRWDVIDHGGRVIGHRHDADAATDLAIRAAQHSHFEGGNVVVCVEQPDGTYKLAFATR